MFKSSPSQGEADQDKNSNEQDYLDWSDVNLNLDWTACNKIFKTCTYMLNSDQEFLD